MAGDTVARSVSKFIYIRVGGQILRIYPPLNKPKTLPAIAKKMRTTFIILGLLCLTTFCKNKTKNIDGYYISTENNGQFYTIDIRDTLALINTDNIFTHQHDTIIVNLKDNSFVRSSPRMFPFYDFKATNDKVTLFFEHDAGNETIEFYRTESRDKKRNLYSTSNLNIRLLDCDSSCYDISDTNVKNILIGRPKRKNEWGDSVQIELDNDIFIKMADLKIMNEIITDSTAIISLHFDKNVPLDVRTRIKNETKGLKNRVVEARFSGDKLKYVD
jgi:hypothetical protein